VWRRTAGRWPPWSSLMHRRQPCGERCRPPAAPSPMPRHSAQHLALLSPVAILLCVHGRQNPCFCEYIPLNASLPPAHLVT
jgi:hypothetical protein